MNKILQISLLLLAMNSLSSFGQAPKKYLVLLKDKVGTPYAISRPAEFLGSRAIQRRQRQRIAVTDRDFPPNPAYVSQIRQQGALAWYGSRWFNAVLIEATDTQLTAVLKLPFVTGIESGRTLKNARNGWQNEPSAVTDKWAVPRAYQPLATNHSSLLATPYSSLTTTLPYGASAEQLTQIGVDVMHGRGFHGEGMLIAVLDAGFLNADKVSFLKPLFDEKRIIGTVDFVQREAAVYEDDDHGLSVLSTMAAVSDNALYGSAYKASYLLLRTEDAATESRLEEVNWLLGAEYADSTGADLITSSLGYTEFDDAASNYTYKDLNGTTGLATRAATMAAEAGMVVLSAAGNDGTTAWKYISVPADAVPVLAVAAVDRTGAKASFSSFGPAPDGRIKPDVAARGQGTVIGLPDGRIAAGNGTSFATPLLAGMVAGFWQAYPTLRAIDVVNAIRRAGNQANAPDDRLGYGIPTFGRAAAIAGAPLVLGIAAEPLQAIQVWPVPFSEGDVVRMSWDEPTNTGSASSPNQSVAVAVAVTVADAFGRVVWQNTIQPVFIATGTGQTRAELHLLLGNAPLAAGFYLLTAQSETSTKTVRIIKR